jgi:DNA polymerase elongation subunit (family B)
MHLSLHGKIINFDGVKSLQCIPKRDELLDPEMVKETDSIISFSGGNNFPPTDEGKDLLFLPNSFKEFHEKNEHGNMEYKILIFGILPDGRKTAVILEGLVPYFEIRKPDDMSIEKFRAKVNGILDEKYRGSYIKELAANGFNQYEREQSTYLRLSFTNIWDRKNALKYFSETLEWQTTTDDDNHYERVACRNNNFSMCAWNVIKKYKSFKKESVCKLPQSFCVNYKDFVEYDGDITTNTNLSRDRTIVETWDIEAYTDTGEMPDADNTKDVVFMIGKTYHWKDSKESMLDICLVSRPCNARPDKLTIVCKNEKELIKASFMLNSIIMPDFIIGFNDGDFDWPFVIKKATKFGVLTFIRDQLTLFNDYRVDKQSQREQIESILKWDCQKKRIKLEADTVAYSTTLALPGYINIDVRTMFRKLYPTEPKSSLKYYLAMSNLGGKEDMPISELFRIFKESIDLEAEINEMVKSKNTKGLADVQLRYEVNKEKMADIAHYCTIDAKRCQELMQKVNIIGDKREVSNVSHTTLYDALYFADGMKVRNLVIAEGQKRGFLFSTKQKPYIGDGKYPGAYVFPPEKGPVKPKLSVRERKATLPEWKDVPDEDVKMMEDAIFYTQSKVPALYYNEKWDTDTQPYTQEKYLEHIIDENNPDTYEIKYTPVIPEFIHITSRPLFEKFVKEKNKYPVSGLDFSSLYPSIIMAYNLSPEYMVFTEKDAIELAKEGHDLHKIEFMFNEDLQVAWSIRHDTFDGEKLLPGKQKNKFGLYPYILKKLFDKRSYMKKGMGVLAKRKELSEKSCNHNADEYTNICFNYKYIDSKQKALKVFMNTFYGETGNKKSPNFVLAIAGGITSAGQRSIKIIAKLVTANGCDVVGETGDTDTEGCRLYYGDSVTADTPLLIKYVGGSNDGLVDITTIEVLFGDESGTQKPYPQLKPFDLGERIHKEKTEFEGEQKFQVWCGKWANINKVIRHKTNKKLYRVNTHTGCVDVTEDHSLLRPDGGKIKPSELKVGEKLLHSFPPFDTGEKDSFYDFKSNELYIPTTLEEKKAFVYGFFYGDGSCGRYECPSGIKWSWTLNNQDPTVIYYLLGYLEDVYLDDFKRLETLVSSGVYKIVPCGGNIKKYVLEYRSQFYDKDRLKKVPICIINGDVNIRKAFMSGYYTADGYKQYNKGKIGSQGLYYMCKSLGYKCSVQIRKDKMNIYRVNSTYSQQRKDPTCVKKIIELPPVTQDTFVYDLETDEGKFHCGVGEIVVKNTDSCYISCPPKHFAGLDREYYGGRMDKKDYCTELVKETFKQIEVIKKLANDYLIADNGTGFLKMAYEEVLYPCLFLLKKMYAGVEHQSIVNFEPHVDDLFTKGLSLKRRGTSEVLKTVCKEVLMEILNINTTDNVRNIVQHKIKEIYERKWDMEDFKKTAVYKPSKQNVSVRTFLKRMEDRNDPMCPIPQAGERFEYVVVKKYPYRYDIKGRKTALKIGEMWEYYEYAVEQKLEIDLDYYMTGGIIGQFSQFVAYHPEFQVVPTDNSQEASDIAEKKTLMTAKKYIEALCKVLSNAPVCQGAVLKELYKLANKSYKNTLQHVLKDADAGQIKLMSFECSSGSDLYAYMRAVLVEESKKSAGYYAECYIEYMRKKYGKKIVYLLLKIYTNTHEPLLKYRTMYVAQVEDRARKTFVENMKGFMELFASRDLLIEDMMKKMKSKLDLDELDAMSWGNSKIPDHKTFESNPEISNIIDGKADDQNKKLEDQKESISMLYDIYNTLSVSMTYLENTRSVVERLQFYISKERQENPMPPGVTVEDEQNNAILYIKRNLIEF